MYCNDMIFKGDVCKGDAYLGKTCKLKASKVTSLKENIFKGKRVRVFW
jgi:hypothetical protein